MRRSTIMVTCCAAMIALAGCNSGTVATAAAPTYGTTTTGATSAPPPSPSGAVSLRKGSQGTFLVGPNGKTLYLFEADTTNTSNCNGACAAAWPPLTVDGKPQAGSGVMADKLTTIKRSDGASQVAYFGHPMYYFAGDLQPNATNGQCLDQFGAKWFVVGADGKKITTC